MSEPSGPKIMVPETISVGAFSVPDAERLLATLVANDIEPQIDVDDGIRHVSARFGSGGMRARVEVFVPSDVYERACAIRDDELKLTGEV